MNTAFNSPVRKSLRAMSLCLAFATSVGSSAFAADATTIQAAPMNVYVGANYGFQIRTDCGKADVCSAGRDAFKMFGGYRYTPNVAAEISYFYLGNRTQVWAEGNPAAPTRNHVIGTALTRVTVEEERSRTQALAVGVNLETELFDFFTNHLRAGLGYSLVKRDFEFTNGSSGAIAQKRFFPYVGVGMSYLVSPSIRIRSDVDVLLNPDRTFYVVTIGATGEF